MVQTTVTFLTLEQQNGVRSTPRYGSRINCLYCINKRSSTLNASVAAGISRTAALVQSSS